MELGLNGQVALVTGGGQGVGEGPFARTAVVDDGEGDPFLAETPIIGLEQIREDPAIEALAMPRALFRLIIEVRNRFCRQLAERFVTDVEDRSRHGSGIAGRSGPQNMLVVEVAFADAL